MPFKDENTILQRCIDVHGDTYDYSKFKYTGYKNKSCIICKKHGEFWMLPSCHYSLKQGCPTCGELSRVEKRTYSLDDFISTLSKELKQEIDFSDTVYKGMHRHIRVRCRKHDHVYSVDPGTMRGRNKNYCSICTKEVNELAKRERAQQYWNTIGIDKAKKQHGDKYDYSKVQLTENQKQNVIIICPEHGEFTQVIHYHLAGNGCPKCSSSRGEELIRIFLEKHNIEYIHQYPVKIGKSTKQIDFFLPEKNIAIEFNGMQHYKPIEWFGGQESFDKQIKRDKQVRSYCKNNQIKLIEIPYKELNIICNKLQQCFKQVETC